MDAFASTSDEICCGIEPLATIPPTGDVTTLMLVILDGMATEAECHRLSELVASDRILRKRYMEAVQLEADLRGYFCPMDSKVYEDVC